MANLQISTNRTSKYETAAYWRRWIKTAKKAAKRHWDEGRAAWAEYESNSDAPSFVRQLRASTSRPHPGYWSATDTLLPAYYARTPEITTERAFGVDDPTALVAATIKERLGEYLARNCDFDAVMQSAVLDFIHTDKASVQIIYDADFETEEIRRTLTQNETGAFIDDSGAVYAGEAEQDQITGEIFYTESVTRPTSQAISLQVSHYDEVLHTPNAKSNSEVKEKAYYFLMERDEAEARFAEKSKQINWLKGHSKKSADDDEREDADAIGEYIEGWEIYSKRTNKVYWMSDQYTDGFLDVQDNPYQLAGFFPSTDFIIGSPRSKSLYPTPIYKRLTPVINQLHDCTDRVSKLIRGIRRRALVDGADDELILALNTLEEGEFVAVKNLQALLEKGGIQNKVWYVPVQELVNAITELVQLEDKFSNDFDKWFGVPDILRGGGDPLETATGQQIRSNAAHNRFKFRKKQIAQMARDAIEMMIDLALGVYDDDAISEIVGAKHMSAEDKQLFPAALELARNDTASNIRIEIDTDSLSFVDEQREAIIMNQAVNTLTSGLNSIAQMMQQSPKLGGIALQALLMSLETIAPGRQFEGPTKAAVEAMLKESQQPDDSPPPPDYEAMKLQLEQQKQQTQSQIEQQKLQLQQIELNLKGQKSQSEIQVEQYKLQLETQMQQFVIQLETQRQLLEQQQLQIENFKAQAQARESYLEEVRLAQGQDLATQKAIMPPPPAAPPESKPSAVVNINVDAQPQPEPLTVTPTIADILGNDDGANGL